MDETINIVACIESYKDCDDIHVLDSGSTDGTRELAEALGAQVHVHKFESFGSQRNWAIDNIPVKHDWILHLDADERLTDTLSSEMRAVLASNPEEAGYYLPSKLIFMGRVLKHLAYRMPFRAAMRWWSIMLLQGGFIEGRAARNYATLVTTYERMTGVKIRWLEHAVRLSRESSTPTKQAREENPSA
jgi:glycosyltransferase involved in cell wall biosynthesis